MIIVTQPSSRNANREWEKIPTHKRMELCKANSPLLGAGGLSKKPLNLKAPDSRSKRWYFGFGAFYFDFENLEL